jgi:hypothetical protein
MVTESGSGTWLQHRALRQATDIFINKKERLSQEIFKIENLGLWFLVYGLWFSKD